MASDTARAEGAGGRTGPCSSHPWNASGGPPISRFVFRCCFPGADNSRSVTAPRSVGRPRRCAENPPAQQRGLDERTAYAVTSIAGAGLSVNVRTAPGQAAIHRATPEARSTDHARPPPGPGERGCRCKDLAHHHFPLVDCGSCVRGETTRGTFGSAPMLPAPGGAAAAGRCRLLCSASSFSRERHTCFTWVRIESQYFTSGPRSMAAVHPVALKLGRANPELGEGIVQLDPDSIPAKNHRGSALV